MSIFQNVITCSNFWLLHIVIMKMNASDSDSCYHFGTDGQYLGL
jgi:hypothetical protein